MSESCNKAVAIGASRPRSARRVPCDGLCQSSLLVTMLTGMWTALMLASALCISLSMAPVHVRALEVDTILVQDGTVTVDGRVPAGAPGGPAVAVTKTKATGSLASRFVDAVNEFTARMSKKAGKKTAAAVLHIESMVVQNGNCHAAGGAGADVAGGATTLLTLPSSSQPASPVKKKSSGGRKKRGKKGGRALKAEGADASNHMVGIKAEVKVVTASGAGGRAQACPPGTKPVDKSSLLRQLSDQERDTLLASGELAPFGAPCSPNPSVDGASRGAALDKAALQITQALQSKLSTPSATGLRQDSAGAAANPKATKGGSTTNGASGPVTSAAAGLYTPDSSSLSTSSSSKSQSSSSSSSSSSSQQQQQRVAPLSQPPRVWARAASAFQASIPSSFQTHFASLPSTPRSRRVGDYQHPYGKQAERLQLRKPSPPYLTASPSLLQFRSPLGQPGLRSVVIHNRYSDRTAIGGGGGGAGPTGAAASLLAAGLAGWPEGEDLLLLSVTTDDEQFAPYEFSVTSVPPGGNATLWLSFLPAALGSAHARALVQTSAGALVIQLVADAWPSPYGRSLAPIVDKVIPMGGSLHRLVMLHNPWDEPLSVLQVFSDTDAVRVSLPPPLPDTPAKQAAGAAADSTANKGATTVDRTSTPAATVAAGTSNSVGPSGSFSWEIPPHTAREVARVEVIPASLGRLTGHVHLRTSRQHLVILIDVVSMRGCHLVPAELDLGVLVEAGESVTGGAQLANLGGKPVAVRDVALLPPFNAPPPRANGSANVDGTSTVATWPVHLQVANKPIVPHGRMAPLLSLSYAGVREGEVLDRLLVRTNDSHADGRHLTEEAGVIELPFWATVAHGRLGYDPSETLFYSGDRGKVGDKRQGKDKGVDTAGAAAIPFVVSSGSDDLGVAEREAGEARHAYADTTRVRVLRLTNHFSMPLVFYAASVWGDPHMTVQRFVPEGGMGAAVAPGQLGATVTIAYVDNATLAGVLPAASTTASSSTGPSPGSLLYTTHLSVATNLTYHKVPLHVYHGRLVASLVDAGALQGADGSTNVIASAAVPTGGASSPREPAAATAAPGGFSKAADASVPLFRGSSPERDGGATTGPAASSSQTAQPSAPSTGAAQGAPATSGRGASLLVDFGVLAVDETRRRAFMLTNPNPVPVALFSARCNLTAVTVRLESVAPPSEDGAVGAATEGSARGPRRQGGQQEGRSERVGRVTSAPANASINGQFAPAGGLLSGAGSSGAVGGKDGTGASRTTMGLGGGVEGEGGAVVGGTVVVLAPGGHAVFVLDLLATEEEMVTGLVTVNTPYETLAVAIAYVAVRGALIVSPALVRFEASFPGRVTSASLTAVSTFPVPLRVTSASSSDARVVPELAPVVLLPNKPIEIGRLLFDPARVAPEDNYMSDAAFLSAAVPCTGGPGCGGQEGDRILSSHQGSTALRRREVLWESLAARGLTDVRASLTLHTDVVKGLTLAVRGQLARPTVLREPTLNFSRTHLGTASHMLLYVTNPSDSPLLVQLVPTLLLTSAPDSAGIHPVGSGAVSPGGHLGVSALAAMAVARAGEAAHDPAGGPRSPAKGAGLARPGGSAGSSGGAMSSAALAAAAVAGMGFGDPQPGSNLAGLWDASGEGGDGGVFYLADDAVVEAVVPPHGARGMGPVVFRPPSLGVFVGALVLKNNLSLLHSVELIGEGATGRLRIHSLDAAVARSASSHAPAAVTLASTGSGADSGTSGKEAHVFDEASGVWATVVGPPGHALTGSSARNDGSAGFAREREGDVRDWGATLWSWLGFDTVVPDPLWPQAGANPSPPFSISSSLLAWAARWFLVGKGSLRDDDVPISIHRPGLSFHLNASHLGFLEQPGAGGRTRYQLAGSSPSLQWPVAVRRQFAAVNHGTMPVHVQGIEVWPCGGGSQLGAGGALTPRASSAYGSAGQGWPAPGGGGAAGGCAFVVESAVPKSGFKILPGQAKPISVSFWPDLTSSLVVRELRVATQVGVLSFPLVAHVPQNLLPACLDAMAPTLRDRVLRRAASALLCMLLAATVLLLLAEYRAARDAAASAQRQSKAVALSSSSSSAPGARRGWLARLGWPWGDATWEWGGGGDAAAEDGALGCPGGEQHKRASRALHAAMGGYPPCQGAGDAEWPHGGDASGARGADQGGATQWAGGALGSAPVARRSSSDAWEAILRAKASAEETAAAGADAGGMEGASGAAGSGVKGRLHPAHSQGSSHGPARSLSSSSDDHDLGSDSVGATPGSTPGGSLDKARVGRKKKKHDKEKKAAAARGGGESGGFPALNRFASFPGGQVDQDADASSGAHGAADGGLRSHKSLSPPRGAHMEAEVVASPSPAQPARDASAPSPGPRVGEGGGPVPSSAVLAVAHSVAAAVAKAGVSTGAAAKGPTRASPTDVGTATGGGGAAAMLAKGVAAEAASSATAGLQGRPAQGDASGASSKAYPVTSGGNNSLPQRTQAQVGQGAAGTRAGKLATAQDAGSVADKGAAQGAQGAVRKAPTTEQGGILPVADAGKLGKPAGQASSGPSLALLVRNGAATSKDAGVAARATGTVASSNVGNATSGSAVGPSIKTTHGAMPTAHHSGMGVAGAGASSSGGMLKPASGSTAVVVPFGSAAQPLASKGAVGGGFAAHPASAGAAGGVGSGAATVRTKGKFVGNTGGVVPHASPASDAPAVGAGRNQGGFRGGSAYNVGGSGDSGAAIKSSSVSSGHGGTNNMLGSGVTGMGVAIQGPLASASSYEAPYATVFGGAAPLQGAVSGGIGGSFPAPDSLLQGPSMGMSLGVDASGGKPQGLGPRHHKVPSFVDDLDMIVEQPAMKTGVAPVCPTGVAAGSGSTGLGVGGTLDPLNNSGSGAGLFGLGGSASEDHSHSSPGLFELGSSGLSLGRWNSDSWEEEVRTMNDLVAYDIWGNHFPAALPSAPALGGGTDQGPRGGLGIGGAGAGGALASAGATVARPQRAAQQALPSSLGLARIPLSSGGPLGGMGSLSSPLAAPPADTVSSLFAQSAFGRAAGDLGMGRGMGEGMSRAALSQRAFISSSLGHGGALPSSGSGGLLRFPDMGTGFEPLGAGGSSGVDASTLDRVDGGDYSASAFAGFSVFSQLGIGDADLTPGRHDARGLGVGLGGSSLQRSGGSGGYGRDMQSLLRSSVDGGSGGMGGGAVGSMAWDLGGGSVDDFGIALGSSGAAMMGYDDVSVVGKSGNADAHSGQGMARGGPTGPLSSAGMRMFMNPQGPQGGIGQGQRPGWMAQ
eukprot:jgi/Mesvir1/14241/Mv09679-RA.1